ncbi:MAG: hypothetical protein JST15_07150 [Bacteroidetes bacterium]|nr:hypothetical protein [Bacteroidota bacterium]
MFFYFLIVFIIIQRLTELTISRRNEKWLLDNGAEEFGKEHYKFIVLMHILFFISLIAEYTIQTGHYDLNIINYLFLVLFILLQFGRISVIRSLGKYWNTKIFRIRGSGLIRTGLYKYIKHPNYIIVSLELIAIPLIFNLYYTAVIFTVLNAVMLTIRIKTENIALKN